jgi:hypothetical protein
MWLGLMYFTQGDEVFGADPTIVVAYEPHRLFTVGAPAAAAPTLIRLLREAAAEAPVCAPRCGHCGEPLEVPPLDDPEPACASA